MSDTGGSHFRSWDTGKRRVSSLLCRPSAGLAACRARRCWRWRAACRDDLPRRFLCLSRVHPPPSDGSAPHARLSRLHSFQCTLVVLRCRSQRRSAEQCLGSCGDAWRASLHRCRPPTRSAAPMSARDLHVVGALCIFLVAAPAASFTVSCRATARRWCCARVRFLLLGVARTTSWQWPVSLASRGGAQEDRQGREVGRNIWVGRMALYYECANISDFASSVCEISIGQWSKLGQSELGHVQGSCLLRAACS